MPFLAVPKIGLEGNKDQVIQDFIWYDFIKYSMIWFQLSHWIFSI